MGATPHNCERNPVSGEPGSIFSLYRLQNDGSFSPTAGDSPTLAGSDRHTEATTKPLTRNDLEAATPRPATTSRFPVHFYEHAAIEAAWRSLSKQIDRTGCSPDPRDNDSANPTSKILELAQLRDTGLISSWEHDRRLRALADQYRLDNAGPDNRDGLGSDTR